MHTWKIEIEYDGTRYRGWQMQPQTRTIQGELIRAAQDYFQQRVEVGGAGRTDAGVHATAQIAHLKVRDFEGDITPRRLIFALNDRLPFDINVTRAANAPNEFHARHSAVSRQYLYQISMRRTAFAKNHVWWIKDKLNVNAMAKAAEMVVGKHDFKTFCEIDDEKDNTIVTVESAEITTVGNMIYFRIKADRFLWKMVRRIMGTIAEIGRGKLTISEFDAMFYSHSPLPAKLTAPPSGLFLEKINYTK